MRTRLRIGAVARGAFVPQSAAGLARCPPQVRPQGFTVTALRCCVGVVLSTTFLAPFAAPASGAQVDVLRILKAEIGANDGIGPGKNKQWDERPDTIVPITPQNVDAVAVLEPPLINEEVTAGGAKASLRLESTSTAQIGHLTVYLSGNAFARNSNLIDLAGVTVGPTLGGTLTAATWRDGLFFQSVGLAPGTPIKFSAVLHFQSGAAATVAGGPAEGSRTGTARAQVNWNPIGFSLTDPQQALLANASDNLTHTITSSTGGGAAEFEFQVQVPVGEWHPFGATLAAVGSIGLVSADPGIFPNAGSATASFAAIASRSLTWGGITGVVNAQTGEPITNWTVTSESGFDYSRPFEEAVPEPASLVLLLAAGPVLARPARHRR